MWETNLGRGPVHSSINKLMNKISVDEKPNVEIDGVKNAKIT